MMAFITRCWKSASWIAAALLLALFTSAHAGSIEPTDANLNPSEDGYSLSANFNVLIGTHLEEVLTKGGVPLHFNLEFVLERPRKYWVAEHIVSRAVTYRLTYSGLTRQYRLSSGALYTNFGSLEEALRGVGRIAALAVVEKGRLLPGESYDAAVRLSLDRAQLPKPFQLDVITDKDWQVTAKTLRWKFVAPSSVAAAP
jgi:Domain of unknown function (DUF4390)